MSGGHRGGGSVRVLLVEQNPVTRMISRRVLERAGCEVALAAPAAAEAALAAGPPALILIDGEDPTCGPPLVARLAARADGAQIAALVSLADPARRADLLDAGAAALLERPFTPEQVRSLLTRRPAVIDPDAIAELVDLEGGAPGFVGHMIATYLESAAALVGLAAACLASGDSAGAQRAAHSLKSSSANIGARDLSRLSREVELACARGFPAAARGLLPSLRRSWDTAREALVDLQRKHPEGTPAAAGGSGPLILVADDEPAARALVRATLAPAGYRILETTDGASTLAALEREAPALVLLDVVLGQDLGFSICARLRADEARADLPVLFMTGLDDTDSIRRGFEVGATDFILKPFKPTILLHRVRYMLRSAESFQALRRSEARVRRLAFHDPVTDLPNRSHFMEVLEGAIQRHPEEPKALIYLDCDRFKRVNDALGHAAGDELLRAIAGRLRASLPEHATLARLGGDEFAALIPLEDPEQSGAYASELLAALSAPFSLRGRDIIVGASAGLCLYPHDGVDGERLLRDADLAMYRAKDLGGERVARISDLPGAATVEPVELETDLRLAIDRGELVLHYQPRVDASGWTMHGAEALVRWQHPKLGLVSPGCFIPLAEQTGLIVPMGLWVLREACTRWKAWLDQGLPVGRLSVNLSARQLAQPDLERQIFTILQETGLPVSRLELEITESALMHDVEVCLETLRRLEQAGITLAIDDFGTGHSSLTYLRRLPVHTLKIDRSFIQHVARAEDDQTITATVIALGKTLRMRVVAEGVETEEQVAFLIERGCDEYQGFLFSRPLAAIDLEHFAAERTRASA